MTAAARSVAATLIALAVVAGGASRARATTLDPFRSGTTRTTLDPVRVADATAAPTPTPAPTPATAPTPVAAKCQSDEQCPANHFCDQGGVCQRIQTRTNFLYLYYHEGSFTEVLLLYWSKRGAEGYRVLAPFYWHFYTPNSETTVIVPGLPVSWSHG